MRPSARYCALRLPNAARGACIYLSWVPTTTTTPSRFHPHGELTDTPGPRPCKTSGGTRQPTNRMLSRRMSTHTDEWPLPLRLVKVSLRLDSCMYPTPSRSLHATVGLLKEAGQARVSLPDAPSILKCETCAPRSTIRIGAAELVSASYTATSKVPHSRNHVEPLKIAHRPCWPRFLALQRPG